MGFVRYAIEDCPHGYKLMSVMWRIADVSRTYGDFRVVPEATIGGPSGWRLYLGACKWHTMSIKDLGGPAPKYLPCSRTAAGDHRNRSMTRIPDFHEEMERFQNHIPTWIGHNLNRLRGDRAKWLRVPTGVALIGGGVLGFLPLPVVAVWMLPVGLALLAHDIPTMRRPMARLLHFTNRRIEKRKS